MTDQPAPTNPKNLPPDQKIDAGIKRAYQIYGPDLNAFFLAVAAEIITRAETQATKQEALLLKSR